MVDSGRLDIQIEIKSKGTTLDAYGEPGHTDYTLVSTVWAQRVRIGALETFLAGSDQPLNLTRFRIRYRTGLSEDMVIEYDGYRYDINGIEGDGHNRRQWLLITATRNERTA